MQAYVCTRRTPIVEPFIYRLLEIIHKACLETVFSFRMEKANVPIRKIRWQIVNGFWRNTIKTLISFFFQVFSRKVISFHQISPVLRKQTRALTHFVPPVSFYTHLKTSENWRFLDVFRDTERDQWNAVGKSAIILLQIIF